MQRHSSLARQSSFAPLRVTILDNSVDGQFTVSGGVETGIVVSNLEGSPLGAFGGWQLVARPMSRRVRGDSLPCLFRRLTPGVVLPLPGLRPLPGTSMDHVLGRWQDSLPDVLGEDLRATVPQQPMQRSFLAKTLGFLLQRELKPAPFLFSLFL